MGARMGARKIAVILTRTFPKPSPQDRGHDCPKVQDRQPLCRMKAFRTLNPCKASFTMSQATQATRKIAIETPLGEDVLLLRGFSASEQISRLFAFELDLLSENHEINFDEIIGQNVTIRVDLPGGGTRYWNGFINRFVQGASTSRRFAQYRATMVPWLWFLTLKSDCRIFQEMSVPEIVRQVFEDLGFSDIEDRTSGGYRQWTYCVQYRETAFNFVSRLMEQEGIYYYFAHEQGKCTIVLCDSRSKHDAFADYEEIAFTPETRASSTHERINEWTVVKNASSGKFAHTDYNFLKPSASLMSVEEDQKEHAHAGYEIFDFPGEYAENADGDKYAKIRMEELAQSHEVCDGISDSRGLCAGYLFTLTRHTRRDQNREVPDHFHHMSCCSRGLRDFRRPAGAMDMFLHGDPEHCPVPTGAHDPQTCYRRYANRRRLWTGRR
jgi:type VI secretion system secreted protein VgrG